MSARSASIRSPCGCATTAYHRLSVDPASPPTCTEASQRRHVVVKTSSSTSENTGLHHASSAVSRPTSPDDCPVLRRPRPGRHGASTAPTGVIAVSTWTKSNGDDLRPLTVNRRLTPRPTPLTGGSSSGALASQYHL